MKQRLARNQYIAREKNFQVIDEYIPPSQHKFREMIVDDTKALFQVKFHKTLSTKKTFQTRIKSDIGYQTCQFSGISDNKPEEAIKNLKIQEERKQKLDEIEMDRQQDIPEKTLNYWKKYLPLHDTLHMMGDGTAFPFLEKGKFDEDLLNQVNVDSINLEDKEPFHLFFRTLGTKDRCDLDEA